MVAPSGFWGVQSVPKAVQSCGFLIPRKIWPLMQISGSSVSISPPHQTAVRRHARGTRNAIEAALAECADSSPLRSHHLEDILYQFLGRTVPLASKYPGILVFHDIAPCFEQAHGHQCSLQNIERLKTGNDNWDVVALGDRLVIAVAHTCTHGPGQGIPARDSG